MIKNSWVRNFSSFFSILAILTATSAVALAFSDKTKGEIIVSGNSDGNGSYVMLDGQKAYNGRTFISSGTIKTENTSAIVKLNGLGLVKLAPNTTLNLDVADGNISGTLTDGKVKVLNKKGVKASIDSADSNVSSDGTEKNIFDVSLNSGKTVANAETGSIFVNEGTNTTVITPQDDDDDDDENILPLVLIFAGTVALASYFIIRSRDDEDELNTISATF